MKITLSTCFYELDSKFDTLTYVSWMNNFISIVNHFYLVIYTDKKTRKYIKTKNNPNIRIFLKPLEEFHTYVLKDQWIKNHEQNIWLNTKTCWEVNMLWSEKIAFVKKTADENPFNTELFGWCDIGYFRNRTNDIHSDFLKNWASETAINREFANHELIHYARINDNCQTVNDLFKLANSRNDVGLPIIKIPPAQNSIAGGFFLIHCKKINWWFDLYYRTLKLYFDNNRVVKDDQLILIDCIFSNLKNFHLSKQENNLPFDKWFMFQQILL
jgi:hypothetical protein